VAAFAILIIDVTPRRLARSQSELGIASAPLDVASGAQREQKDGRESHHQALQNALIKNFELKKPNFGHPNKYLKINLVIPHGGPASRNQQYWRGLCEIFTNENSVLIAKMNSDPAEILENRHWQGGLRTLA